MRLTIFVAAIIAYLALGGVAFAQPPFDCRFSVIPTVVVGNASGNAIQTTESNVPGFVVIARDVNLAPLQGLTVFLDFPNTAKVGSTQNSGTTVNCTARSLSKVTDVAGRAIFAAKIGEFSNSDVVDVWIDGATCATVKYRSTDWNGNGQTDLSDYAAFSNVYLNGPYSAEFDYDVDGSVGLADYSIFGTEYNSSGTVTYCP